MIDLAEILDRKVRVLIDGETKLMHPREAELEQCASKALKGDIRACKRFIKDCLQNGLLSVLEAEDDFVSRIEVPRDWDRDEFMAKYDKLGPPPWCGDRDGLTAAEREKQLNLGKRKRRS